METPPKICLSFSLLDSSLGCGPGQQAQFPDDSLTHCAARPPLRVWYTGLCHQCFNLGAQQTAGGSLEGLQIQKRALSSCRWGTWWGLFKAGPLEPLPGANSPTPAPAMSPGISLPMLLLQAFTGSPVSCGFLVPRLWGEDPVRPGAEGGGRKRLMWNKLKSLLCAALK